ncbi:unnamed protein product [Aspergillus oryzae var. brunneus]|uniref:Unnamed protein product n=2 Tax=Aspergillus oryzae TaxID=5062 RepID=A0AAN5BUX0_ASPOZ|nr:unnamed protein product [Aspergillus oryzae]GMG50107.1 unnamed protein product [Aspergillus oryzae var. brunneus]
MPPLIGMAWARGQPMRATKKRATKTFIVIVGKYGYEETFVEDVSLICLLIGGYVTEVCLKTGLKKKSEVKPETQLRRWLPKFSHNSIMMTSTLPMFAQPPAAVITKAMISHSRSCSDIYC